MNFVKWSTSFDDSVFDNDYLTDDEYNEMYRLTIQELRKNGYHFDGNYHQNGDHGMPLFDNGKFFAVSMRTWGAIMAEAFPEEYENPDYRFNYVRWYLGPSEDGVNSLDYSQYKYPE